MPRIRAKRDITLDFATHSVHTSAPLYIVKERYNQISTLVGDSWLNPSLWSLHTKLQKNLSYVDIEQIGQFIGVHNLLCMYSRRFVLVYNVYAK